MEYEKVIEELKPVIEDISKKRIAVENGEIKRHFDENRATFRVTSKLNGLLRKDMTMTREQALRMYDTEEKIHKKFCEILDIVDYINNVGEIAFIIDKQMVCAYMQITVDTYQYLLLDATIDLNVQMVMQNIEDYLISTAQQGGENHIRHDASIARRLATKGKFGGNDVEYHKRVEQTNVMDAEYSEIDLQKKLQSLYNFNKLLSGNGKGE